MGQLQSKTSNPLVPFYLAIGFEADVLSMVKKIYAVDGNHFINELKDPFKAALY
jgi:hypothetical protein